MSKPYEQQPLAPTEPTPAQNYEPPHLSPQDFAPPFPQPQGPPLQAQWQPPRPVTNQHNGLAISALVVAVLALLLGLGVVLSQVVSAVVLGGLSSSFVDGMNVMKGTAPQVISGRAYPGKLLQDEVTRVVDNNIGDVTSVTCPATPAVVADAVTVCRGIVDGSALSFKVTFEDGMGHFTLDEKVD